ncbi:MAG: flagellar motor protein MotB [Ignavibacteriae bacterium]|nr:MAG: flagellar motor protein MotB [Ignavibacteriota bacterium]
MFFSSLILMSVHATILAQEVQRTQPTWWFGGAAALNLNFYGGTTQTLNSALMTPSPFHKGFGAGLYLAALVEYRPDPIWGGILQVGYDDRRGSFYDVTRPCGQLLTLSSTISYISIEPSLRIAPFSDGFYIFGGPRIGFNWALNLPKSSLSDEKAFVYTQGTTIASRGEFSEVRKTVISGQIGVGYEFELASPNAKTQVNLAPFISWQPWFFSREPRLTESWAVSTVRAGVAIKFGRGSVIHRTEFVAMPEVVERDVQFSLRAPKAVPVNRRVRESFPLRNYVFFDEGSTEIAGRYILLTKTQAASFKEEQLQEFPPKSMAGRSVRQMTVYDNILNILGDRMKRSPGAVVSLSGASENGPVQGKARAETIKKYLVDVFGIESSRITTEGRDKPRIPSEVSGATKELALLRAEDRRVDIESDSPELMIQVGGGPHYMLKPVHIVAVEEDPLDSHVIFNVVGAKEVLSSWSLEITDDQGKVLRFGPSTREQESISGNAILGDRSKGEYKVVMLGQTKSGRFVRKESAVYLFRRDTPMKDVVRFRILFDFDKSKTVASYETFLTDIVTPLIPDSGVVIIHGYTDIVGDEVYNDSLSNQRAQDAQSILERAIAKSGKKEIMFETFGFGENPQYATFDNFFPEERFYNRSVIIDIVPD